MPGASRNVRSRPSRALDDSEIKQVEETLNSERFADQSPCAVYAALLDEEKYLCSWLHIPDDRERPFRAIVNTDSGDREHQFRTIGSDASLVKPALISTQTGFPGQDSRRVQHARPK